MNVKMFIKWLEENFPQDAVLVTTNSLAWNSREVKEVTEEQLRYFFYLKSNPQKDLKPVEKPCLVLHDERRYDY